MGHWRHCWLHPSHRTLLRGPLPHCPVRRFWAQIWRCSTRGKHGQILEFWGIGVHSCLEPGLMQQDNRRRGWKDGRGQLRGVFRAVQSTGEESAGDGRGLTRQHLPDVQGTWGKSQARDRESRSWRRGLRMWWFPSFGHFLSYFLQWLNFLLEVIIKMLLFYIGVELWSFWEFSYPSAPYFCSALWGGRRWGSYPYFPNKEIGTQRADGISQATQLVDVAARTWDATSNAPSCANYLAQWFSQTHFPPLSVLVYILGRLG